MRSVSYERKLGGSPQNSLFNDIFIPQIRVFWSRDNSVGVVTSCERAILGRGKRIVCTVRRVDRRWSPPSVLSSGLGEGVKAAGP
jgi:hypothetical protein